MLDLAKAISNLYPSLDKDLLYAGVILHDLGKVIELSGPISTTYTLEGNLLGHISIMVNEIGKAADEPANRCRRSINSSTHRAFSPRKSRMG